MHKHDYECIITSHKDIWFCKTCRKAHGALYCDNVNKKHYCESCVPDDIKLKVINVNENGDVLDE